MLSLFRLDVETDDCTLPQDSMKKSITHIKKISAEIGAVSTQVQNGLKVQGQETGWASVVVRRQTWVEAFCVQNMGWLNFLPGLKKGKLGHSTDSS